MSQDIDVKKKGDTKKPAKPKFKLSAFTNNASDEDTEAAKKRLDRAAANDALGESRFRYHMRLQFNHRLPTTDIDTMAVALYADGDNVFMYNPEFVNSLDTTECVQFIEGHEFLHRVLNHVRDDNDRPTDGTWRLVQEIICNAVLLARGSTGKMPHARRVNKAGNTVVEPTGIDPRKMYHDEYLAQCNEAGLTPVSYDKFTESENSCYTELMRLPNPPGQAGNQIVITCEHGEHGDGDGSGGGQSEEDEIMDEIVKGAIQSLVSEARNGSPEAKAELLKLADVTEDGNEKAQKMWGDYGLGALRGKSDATRQVSWWQHWLRNELSSLLVPGERMVMPKKTAAMLLLAGEEPVPVRRGDEEQTYAAMFLDTSGSMSQRTLTNLQAIMGTIPNCKVDWYMFDGKVEKHVLGGVVSGGGGTNFQNCVDVVEGRYAVDGETVDHDYDVVVMLTDGDAPPVSPANPDKWLWLITDSSTDWMKHTAMRWCAIDTAEVAAEAG